MLKVVSVKGVFGGSNIFLQHLSWFWLTSSSGGIAWRWHPSVSAPFKHHPCVARAALDNDAERCPPQKARELGGGGSVMNHVPRRKNVLNRTRTLQHDNFLSQRPISVWQDLRWLGSLLQNGRRALYLCTCFTAIGQSATAVKIHSIDRPVSSL